MPVTQERPKVDYRAIYVSMVSAPEYLELDSDARLLLLTLKITCGPLGIAELYNEQVQRRTGLDDSRFDQACHTLLHREWLKTEYPIWWIVNGFKYEPHLTLNHSKHEATIIRRIDQLPKSQIVADFCRFYGIEHPIRDRYPDRVSEKTRITPPLPTPLPTPEPLPTDRKQTTSSSIAQAPLPTVRASIDLSHNPGKELRDYLGPYASEADRLEQAAEHPFGWEASVWMDYRPPDPEQLIPGGRAAAILLPLPEPDRPVVLSQAIGEYAMQAEPFNARHFAGYVRRAVAVKLKEASNGSAPVPDDEFGKDWEE